MGLGIKVIERRFNSDRQENDYYLDLCERYGQVKRNLWLPNKDGSVYVQYYVTEKVIRILDNDKERVQSIVRG